MGNWYVSGARPYGTIGLEIPRIANNSRVRRNLSFSFMCLWDFELSAAQRKPAQLVDGLFPPKTFFALIIISLHPEFAAYGVLGQAHSQVRVSDQEMCLKEFRRKWLHFKWDKRRRATIERLILEKALVTNWPGISLFVPEWGPNSQHMHHDSLPVLQSLRPQKERAACRSK